MSYPNCQNSGSRVYTNPWVTGHRYPGHVELLDSGNGRDLTFPPTNIVLSAEKSAEL